MFRRLLEPDNVTASAVSVSIDGRIVVVRSGDSVATALLLADRLECRVTPQGGVARGPYCMMGACFDCLVTIDEQPGRQACLVPVAPGMCIDTRRGVR